MAIHDLKDQIARLPEQPGVYLYFNAAGETIYVGKARALRDRVRSYLGAYGVDPKTDALLDEIARLEVIVTDSVVEALALENNLIKQRSPKYNILLRDDKNYPYLQLTTERGVSARPGGAPRRARRRLLRRPVPAGEARAADDGADAPAVRHPVVQRGDHRQARRGRASSTTSSAASRRAWTRSAREAEYQRAVQRHAAVPRRPERRAGRAAARTDGRGRRGGALRGGGAAARRDAHGADAARPAAEDGDGRAGRPRRVRPEGRPGGRGRPGVPGARRPRRRARGAGDRERGRRGARARPTCCRRRSSSSTRCAPCRPRCTCRSTSTMRTRSRSGCRRAPAAGCRCSCRSAARSAGSSTWRSATRRSPTRPASTAARPRTTTRSRRCASVLHLPALPRRIECFDISTIQGSETVASMVVCEDGRMSEERVPEVPRRVPTRCA